MRTKKMLAMLLAVMMVVMMIPIGAAAAVPTGAPEINVELKSTGTFGELTQELTLTNTYKKEWGKTTAKFDKISEYKLFDKAVNATNRAPIMLDPDSSEDWANNVSVYGQLNSAAATSTVNKGGTAYVTVKVTAPASAYGVVPSQVIIKYDTDSFEVPTDKTDVVPNLLATEKAVTRPANVLLDDGTGKTYGGTYEAPSAFTNYAGKEGDTNVGAGKSVTVLKFGYPSAKATLINATGTTWDYVIPFKVKNTATLGEHTFEAISNFKIDANSASTQMWVPKNAYDGTTKLNTSTASTGYDGDPASANAAGDKLKYGSTKVTVTSNDPEIDIVEKTLDPVADQEVVVSISKNGKFASDIAQGDFKIVDSTGNAVPSAPAVKIKGTAAGASTATLQIAANDTNLAANTNYKIQVAANKVTSSTGTAIGTALTSAKTFKIKPAVTGTPTISGTAKYGQTLTASTTGMTNVGTAKYQWYRGTTAITGATSSTYKLTVADVGTGKNIKVRVSDSTGNNYGYQESTPIADVAKVTLARPTSGTKLGTAATATQDVGATASVTKEGTYTFTTDVVAGDTITMKFDAVYTDTMLKTAGNKTGLVATLKGNLLGTNNGGYELAAASGETYTADGTVSAAGYVLKGTNNMTFKSNTDDSVIAADTVVASGTTVKVTWGGTAPTGQELSGFTVKVGAANATNISSPDLTNKTFTYTTPSGSVTEAIDVVFAPTFGTAATPVEFTGLDKTYDGTDEWKGTMTPEVPNVTVKYDSANAGASLTITGTNAGQDVEIGGTKYRVPSTLTGTINKIDADVSVNTGTGKIASDATIEQVLTAIKGAAIKVEGVETSQGTVGDYFTTDSKISDAIKAAYPAVYPETQPAVTKTENAALPGADVTEYVVGNTYKIAAADATTATFGGDDFATLDTDGDNTVTLNGLTITKDGEGNLTIAVGTDAISADTAVVVGAATTTFKPATPVAESDAVHDWDFSSLAGSSIEIELNLSTADVTTGALFTNVANASSKKLAVTAPINRKGVPAASGVSFDTLGFGKAEYDTADLNSDNKLDALPKVTPKVGLEFRGWSTDGTEVHIVTAETYDPDVDGENTLTAVFRGYMVGNEKSEVRPTANITRKELAKVLVIAAGVYDKDVDYTKDPANLFPDMPHDGWSDNYVACAKKNGIMKGNDLGKGTPNAQITREEAAAMIARVFGVKTSTTDTTDKVNDFDKVSGWAKEYVAALCNNGTINGKPDGSFSGKMNIQRAEAAKMTNIYLGLDDAKKNAIKGDSSIKNPFPDLKGDAMWAYSDLMFASKSVPATFYSDKITVPEAK